VLAAVGQDALLGTAMVGHDGHRGWVYYLAVAPREQRRGLGRRLMQACEQWVHARGIPKLQLMVRATTPPPPPSTSDWATPTPRSPFSANAWTALRRNPVVIWDVAGRPGRGGLELAPYPTVASTTRPADLRGPEPSSGRSPPRTRPQQ